MKRCLLLALALTCCVACATGGGSTRHARYPNQVTAEVQEQFNTAEDLYMKRSFTEADAALAQFIQNAPYTELTDIARFLRGEIAFLKRNYANAVTFYRASYEQVASPKVEPKARFKAAMSLYRLGKKGETLTELMGMNRRDASPVLRLRADSLGVHSSGAGAGGQPPIVLWYLRLLDDYADGADPSKVTVSDERIVTYEEAYAKVKRWIDDKKVTEAEVEALPLAEMKGKTSGGYALYKQALIAHSAGDTARSEKLLRNYISAYPKHEYYGSAQALLGQVGGAVGDAAGVAVGVLVPLSGRNAVYGESVLHGVECALGIYAPCVGPSGMRLIVRDSNSYPGGDAAAVEDLANDKDVLAIVGPLQSAQAVEAATAAQNRNIPLISLSQRDGVAEVGDYTFRNSASTVSEMETLADYAVNVKGLKRFFILYPNSKKGQEYLRLFTDAVKQHGGSIVSSKGYSQKQVQVVNELRGRGAVEMAQMRGEETTPEFSTGGVSYDAIFIPDAFWAASSILQQMGGARGKVLGIARWNDPEQLRRSEYAEGAIFVDSFYKGAPDEVVSGFVTRMREAYNVEPTLLEALGFDTARIVANAATGKGARGRDSMRNAIARINDFPGVSGKTSFNDDGDAQRKMWVLTVSNGQIRVAQ